MAEVEGGGAAIPCTFVGKHLRFSDSDIADIMRAGARQPAGSRERRPHGRG
jgi:hypothetical protein